ncbi:MAG TPA: helix-turn-helix domain-containing protein [Acidimicrobiales bacterium]|nr:helix-turn-helix domain-containing protein [Acidimicrobiales bacterium]
MPRATSWSGEQPGERSGAPTAQGDKSTRERILDVATDLFIEKGYDKTSLREIADRLGFTKAALYYHFPSKEDILGALHQRLHSLVDEPVMLLGDGPVTLATWERFLDACMAKVAANTKLFDVHRVNQAALAKIHIEGHEGAHFEIEELARKIFSDPAVPVGERARMAAALTIAFALPIMSGNFLGGDQEGNFSTALIEIVHDVLRPRERAKTTGATRKPSRRASPS